jgi:hypothetical protein
VSHKVSEDLQGADTPITQLISCRPNPRYDPLLAEAGMVTRQDSSQLFQGAPKRLSMDVAEGMNHQYRYKAKEKKNPTFISKRTRD